MRDQLKVMENQNKNIDELLKELWETLSDDERELMKLVIAGDSFLESILSQVEGYAGIEDEMVKALVFGSLSRQTHREMIFLIWQNMSENEATHFMDYFKQENKINPGQNSDDILISFAMLYPALKSKVYLGLGVFFRKYVDDMNRMLGV